MDKQDYDKLTEVYRQKFREAIGECNGKTMDYESCRLLEDLFDLSISQLVQAFEGAMKQLKNLNTIKKDWLKCNQP